MNEIINKDIEVASVETKQASTGNMKWIIVATNKDKYFFWQTVKGQDSDVYQNFQNMGVKRGSVVHIGYTEEPKSFVNKDGKTVNYIDRFIVGLREASGVRPLPATETSRYEPNIASQSKPGDEFWDKKAYKQCLWNHWLQTGKFQPDVVWAIFNDIEQDADDRFSKPRGWASLGQKLKEEVPLPPEPPISPEVQELADEMEINGEDIPF